MLTPHSPSLAASPMAAQVAGVQGTYTNLVGRRGQGLFQSLFLAATATGLALDVDVILMPPCISH